MSSDPVGTFVQQLRQSQLLDAAQLAELEPLRSAASRPAQLAGELVRRGWITSHQANQVAMGRAASLVIGSYIVLEPIGGGGMGQVVKARHRFMQRNVALKLIRQDQRDSADIIERFQRETRLLADLRHPHIVQAYDAGLAGDVWFLAMELLDGIDLAGLVQQQGRLPVGHACEYIRQAALGLQYAHQRGLVHRDIKPSNLFLTAEGIKLLDLGLARLQASDAPGALTQTNSVMGTPDYLAPEQAVDPRKAGTRSDLYSLGCTLYFLLSGRPPFPEGTLTQKLLYHQQAEPDPIERLRPETPPGLAVLLRRMLAKRPEDRPANAAEAAAHLAPFSAADSASAFPPPAPASADRGKSVLTDATVMPRGPLPPLPAVKTSAAERAGLLTSETVSPAPMPTMSMKEPGGGPPRQDETVRANRPGSTVIQPSTSAAWLALIRRHRRWIGAGAGGFFLLLLVLVLWSGKENKSGSANSFGGMGPSPRVEGTPLRSISMSPELMAWLSISRDGKKLGAIGFVPWRWRSLIWDSHNGSQLGELEKASCAEFSPDGKYLACGHALGEVRLLNPETHALIQSFRVDKSLHPIRGLRFSADGGRLLCFGVGNPGVWDFKENAPLRSFPRVDEYPEEFYRASLTDISPDGKWLATGTTRALLVMAVDTPNHMQEHFPVAEGVISTAFSRDGKYLAAGFKKGGVALGQVLSQNGSLQINKGDLPQLRIPMPRSLAFHPKSHLLAAGSEEGKLYLAAADKGWELSEFRAHNDAVTVLCFSQDGNMLATGDRKGTIKLWEVKR